MSIDEVRTARYVAERKIADVIKEFEADTSLLVSGIGIARQTLSKYSNPDEGTLVTTDEVLVSLNIEL